MKHLLPRSLLGAVALLIPICGSAETHFDCSSKDGTCASTEPAARKNAPATPPPAADKASPPDPPGAEAPAQGQYDPCASCDKEFIEDKKAGKR